MGKITINELSNSLIEQINDKQDKLDNELETSDKTIVGAINELFQETHDGRQLIANAIGEPLTPEDTFIEMSNDINGLLNTFKANMMNNGVTVESGDKFKALIDKIATLTGNEGKGIKFANGVIDDININSATGNINKTITLNNIGFQPTYLLITIENIETIKVNLNTVSDINTSIIVDNIITTSANKVMWRNDEIRLQAYLSNITDESCMIHYVIESYYGNGGYTYINKIKKINYYAIGVGEEDTTQSLTICEGTDFTLHIWEPTSNGPYTTSDDYASYSELEEGYDLKTVNYTGTYTCTATVNPGMYTTGYFEFVVYDSSGKVSKRSSEFEAINSGSSNLGGRTTQSATLSVTAGQKIAVRYRTEGQYEIRLWSFKIQFSLG